MEASYRYCPKHDMVLFHRMVGVPFDVRWWPLAVSISINNPFGSSRLLICSTIAPMMVTMTLHAVRQRALPEARRSAVDRLVVAVGADRRHRL